MKNSFPKSAIIATLLIATFFTASLVQAQIYNLYENPSKQENFYKIQKEKNDFYDNLPEDQRKGWKQFKRWENFWLPRVYPTGEFPQALDIYKDWKLYQDGVKDKLYSTQSKSWTLVGPINSPDGASVSVRDQGLGRVNVIRWHENTPNDIWAGSATGGVWRSTNGGANWFNYPFTEFMSLGVSDIQISKSNPNVIYVATGDMDGSSAAQNYYGIGIIKSTNNGETWELTSVSNALEDRRLFGKMFISPTDPNVVVATTNSAILKTTDGGKNWVSKSNGFFIDLEQKPNDANVLYASTFSYAQSGTDIYKSTDMGDTWKKVKNIPNTIRTAIEVTPKAPNMVYAISAERNTMRFHSYWVSEDAGENFESIYTISNGINLLGWNSNGKDMSKGQGQYDLALAVSPLNESEVFVGGINIWKSSSSGFSWAISAHWYGDNAAQVHADIHDLKYSPDGKTIYAAHDGGIDKSTDGGKTWKFIADGMSITQFYKIGATEADANTFIGGAQDNGSSIYKNSRWIHVLAGDGMDCAIDPTNAQRMYGSLYYGDFRRSTNGGDSFNNMFDKNQTGGEDGAWVAPIAIDPQKTNVIYLGYYNVWRSNAYGNSGSFTKISSFGSQQTLQNIAVSPSNSNYIYASNYSNVYRTTDNGASWLPIISSSTAISDIKVSATDPDVLYYTKSGFTRNDKVWKWDGKIENAVKTTNLSGNLPNIPANTIVYQPDSPDRLYIGTDLGVFYSDYNSNVWEAYGANLPNVIINDLYIQTSTKRLIAGTWGRGLWTAPILECNMPKPEIEALSVTEFCKGDSVVLVAKVEEGNVVWSNGETTKQIVVKEDGNYSFVHTIGGECNSKSDIISVLVHPVPEIAISKSKSPALCIGDSVTLSIPLGISNFKWSTGEDTRRITVKEPGIYYCTVVTGDGCDAVSEKVEVSFHPIPSKPTIHEEFQYLVASEANKYRWYHEGKLIDGATSQKYHPKVTGIYTVEVAEGGDCYTMSDEYDLLSSVNEEWRDLNNAITLSPNPTRGYVNISASVLNGVTAIITVTNIAGQEIAKFSSVGSSNGIVSSIDLSSQPAGTYFITVATPSKSITERVVKQ